MTDLSTLFCNFLNKKRDRNLFRFQFSFRHPYLNDIGCERPVFFENGIYIVDVDFPKGSVRIIRFDCGDYRTVIHAELPLSSVRNCYNLRLRTAPLTLSRQCAGKNEFEVVWPERISFPIGNHDSFFMRDGDEFFFSRWHEEGEGADYRYWEETIVRDPEGNVTETIPGDVMRMPDGEIWRLE